jgi:crotonobetainyl-CoA:carnitine CoA-transferase CaiB-like acyl-CoA transferase
MCGEAFRVAGAPAVHGRAPLLGEHTTAVLTGLMGMSAADVEDLLDSGVAAAAGGAS